MTRRIHRFRRPLLFAAGWILTALGAVGMILPLMPGTIDRRVKLVACGSMLISFAILTRTSAPPIALWTAGLCLLAAGLYVASRPEP